MAFEMICGQCRGNLLVEHFGVVVACPHCGAHLHVPDPNASAPPAPAPVPTPAPMPVPQPAQAPVAPANPSPIPEVTASTTPPAADAPPSQPAAAEAALEAAPSTEELRVFNPENAEPPPSVEISVVSPVAISDSATTSTEIVTEGPAPASGGFSLSSLLSSSEVATEAAKESAKSAVVSEPIPATSDLLATEPPKDAAASDTPLAAATESVPSGLSGLFGATASATPATEAAIIEEAPVVVASSSTVEAPPESGAPSEDGALPAELTESEPAASRSTTIKPGPDHVMVSKSVLLLLFSYASAVTLGFAWLLYQAMTPKDFGIESLPDPVPRKSQKAALYDERMEMPDGHEIKVGDTQRFGNIKVTALRVTRGPLQFRHFSDARKSRLPSAPVLKLWLRFENVSKDQEIAPLDDQLLFTRGGKDRFSYRSNQFVCRAAQKANPNALRVIAFDHRIGSEWDLADLPLDKPLKPGESRDYYVPTCENDLDKLTGELLWRVHIRKGYSSRGNGVTTLFEVRFKSNDIRDETV